MAFSADYSHFRLLMLSIDRLMAINQSRNNLLDGIGWYWMVVDGIGNLRKPSMCCRVCLAGAFFSENSLPGHFWGIIKKVLET